MKSFASDNGSGVCQEVMEAILAANHEHESSYGLDIYTEKARALLKQTFGEESTSYFVYNGTAANVLGLKAITRSHHAILFQTWKQLIKIPYATTISYAKQAEKIGNQNKARAVGMTNGLNPIGIIIPCHRVVGSNGHLVGFAGEIDRKKWLLNHEKRKIEYAKNNIYT